MPFRVDVELHRPHRSDVLQDLRDADHGLIVSGDVNEVAPGVDPTPVRQTRVTPPSVYPHWGLLGSVFSVGFSWLFQTIGARLCRAHATPGPGFGPPLQFTMSTGRPYSR